ncbi:MULTISPECIES: MDR family MFS transporter [Bacillus cereus group]|uniref:Major facilitator superfamily MFS_1 n=2 Tax=Bacillus cytotoxicus TaxID=580165 RepID=A0AAX2CHV1_9BACI|nr:MULTISPECIES: MFS transporter [Bacillus cereus group]ABS22394.1 major facilitator superfamily MFS_1 [Bacillus cytotoxicus NVH 391-98]AWC29001.1 MFS transporter [Bacillus cytotoxicus]AWC45054.1 MFS transporter [Bacillus cytotoxicus]AWC53072.1 MFS transporter [Bacillus cytotoxicus]AWC57201.1 MFS transporter [Bacillus cytotoxicus]
MKNFSTPIRIILISSFFMSFGYFAVYAFLAIYLTNFLHFSALQVGTILTIIIITSRMIPFLSGIIADKFGYMIMMIAGLLLRGGGFIFLGIFSEFHTIVLSSSLIGFGTALYEPAARAVFGSQPAYLRKDLFTYLNLAFNSGAMLGPIAGTLLLAWNPLYPFILTGFMMLLLAIMFIFLKPHFQVSTENIHLLSGLKNVFENKHFLSFSFIMIFFYIMFTQLTVALPLYMTHISHSIKLGGLVVTVNAITGVLFMILFRKAFHRYNTLSIVKCGVLLMGLSFLLIPLLSHPYWLFSCVILFTIGETLVLPNADITIANYSNESYTATYFGVYQLSLAIGFIVGSYTGTLSTSQNEGTYALWIIFGTLGITGFMLLSLLQKFGQKQEKDFIQDM